MSFTVRSIFPKLDNLQEEDVNKHRMAVGLRIRDSWNYRYDTPPLKIAEGGMLVNSYDDEFRDRAIKILNKYLSEQALTSPKAEPKRKRPRIRFEPAYQPLK